MEVVEIVHASASRAPSDDAAGFRRVGGALHLWVIDGATSVSAVPNRADPALSDAAWFARSLSAAIHRSVIQAPLTPARLADLLRRIEARYRARVRGPLAAHDWPVAAMCYACIRVRGRRFVIEGLDYADCFLMARSTTGLRPQPGPTRRPPLPPDASLPKSDTLLAHLRARRGAQVERGVSSAVTIRAESAGRGRRVRMAVRGPALVVLGSDGIARLWEAYGLETAAQAMQRFARHGALRGVLRLRDWERTHAGHGREIKPADDATVLLAVLGLSTPAARWAVRRGDGTTTAWRARAGRLIDGLPLPG